MTYCGQTTFVKSAPGLREAASLKCRAWTCQDCAPGRKAGLIAQAHRGKPNTFITLTCKFGTPPTADEAALALSQAWRLVHKRALREAARDLEKRPLPAGPVPPGGWKVNAQGRVPRQVTLINGKLPYLVVIEATKLGWPHLHVLARSKWIGQQWLSLQMNQLLGSPIVHIARVNKQSQVAGYVAKYCNKCEHKFGTAKRYWETQSFALSKYQRRKEPLGEEWGTWIADTHIKRIVNHWIAEGWHVDWKSSTNALAHHPAHGPP